jgi:ribosomal protein S18 acetylase RimI-like enzyme
VDGVGRAFAFMRRGDMAGSRVEPWRFGCAVFTPELPLRQDSNYLLVEREGEAGEIASEAERVQSELTQRVVVIPNEQLADRLAPRFEVLGWQSMRSVVMVHRRPPARPVDTSIVEEVSEADLRPARELSTRHYSWATPQMVRQLLDFRLWIPIEARFFAVRVEGAPVSFTDLYFEGDTAQVEAVATLEEYRGRGYASAVVTRAVEEARRGGATWVFLVADADDWPKEMYRKLGFDEVGRYSKFTRALDR